MLKIASSTAHLKIDDKEYKIEDEFMKQKYIKENETLLIEDITGMDD